MEVTVHENHEWLKQFLGEWTVENEMVMAPGEPPMKSTGTESARMLGDVWMIANGEGLMPDGSAARWIMTLGYDPQQECFVGAWVGSMMTHLWTYRGSLDAGRRILTLDCEGPSMTGGTAKYQDIHEIAGPGHRILRSRMQGEDGEWSQFMEAHFRRK
jgi:hypothetical protein